MSLLFVGEMKIQGRCPWIPESPGSKPPRSRPPAAPDRGFKGMSENITITNPV